MKAPDKLYLHPNYKGEVGANWLTFSLTNEDVCYIRKDALLKWFNDNIKPLNVLFGEIFVARIKDKLNSM